MSYICFSKASKRLHSDADHLVGDHRNCNAGHLHGLAAECGLKYLLLLCGGLTRDPATGDLVVARGPRPHVNHLIDAGGLAAHYQALVHGHVNARYISLTPSLAGLRTWKPEFRYYDENHANYPHASELDWWLASQEIQEAMDAANLDGHPAY